MSKKLTFLILALLLPALVFVFLKIFGRNEFQVPVLHQHTLPARTDKCEGQYSAPYLVPDSIFRALALNVHDSLFVFNFDKAQDEVIHRVTAEFSGDPVTVVNLSGLGEHIERDFLRSCVLLMHEDSSAAVVDSHRRIRGYYDPRDRDEVDRMIVEIKIMLKQY